MSALVSVSIDLDSVACYHRIHGLAGAPTAAQEHAILRRCLPRFAELLDRHNARATFFVVGQDLHNDTEGRALLADLAKAGHELGSHSFSHPYDLTRMDDAAIADEIDRAHAAIGEATGSGPVGFRAPGYAITAPLLRILCDRNYAYDSSTFPSTPYYLAKATVMGGMRILGRRSASVLDTPRVLRAPTEPYRPALDDPYRRGDAPLIELPMTVTPALRLPVIGTAVISAPEGLRKRLVRSALKRPFFNFELHGIDLADAAGDGFSDALIAKQPDLRVPFAKKLAALESTLTEAAASGARFVTLREAAAQCAV